MDSSQGEISQVKLDAKQIIDCLQQLNSVEDQNSIENLIAHTEYLFGKLEKYPLKKIKTKLKKRKKQKLRTKLNKIKNGRRDLNEFSDIKAAINLESLMISRDSKQKSNNSKGIHECKRFLQTFELLEQLHLSRAHNSSETYKFRLKLRHLKSIWNCLLQEKLKEQTSKKTAIQQQWNEVLFGPPEKTYFDIAPDLQDFLRKRQVWDSYINSNYGSAIPIGWVIPLSDVKEAWKPYLSPTNP